MGDVVSDFVAITGVSEDEAINYLSNTDFVLADAVNLFQAANNEQPGRHHNRAPRSPPTRGRSPPPSHQHVSRLFDDAPSFDQPQVDPFVALMELARGSLGQPRGHPQPTHRSSRVEEIPSVDDDVGPTPQQRGGTMGRQFRAPNYAFWGTFAECCKRAIEKKRWVILSVVLEGDFKSGCINRDLWLNDMARDVIPAAFTLFQTLSNSDEGSLLVSEYRMERRDLPCIWFVDPLTRAVKDKLVMSRLMQNDGTYSSQSFLEEVTTFLERYPSKFAAMESRGSEEQLADDSGISYDTTARPAFLPPHSSPAGVAEGVYDADDDDQILAAVLRESAREAEEQQKRLESETAASSLSSTTTSQPAMKQAKTEVVRGHSPLQTQAVTTSPTPPPVVKATPTAPDVSAYLVSSSGPNDFKLRFRLPHGSVDVLVSGAIPVALLIEHVEYMIYAANPTQYPLPPNIELRGGFPPKPLSVPNTTITLSEWGALRQNDNVLVHLLM